MRYPDVGELVPKAPPHHVVIDGRAAEERINALAALARGVEYRGGPKTYHCELRAQGTGPIELVAEVEFGDEQSNVDVPLVIGQGFGEGSWSLFLSVRYLRAALKGARGPVKVSVVDARSPVLIERADGERHVIMPMRL